MTTEEIEQIRQIVREEIKAARKDRKKKKKNKKSGAHADSKDLKTDTPSDDSTWVDPFSSVK